MTRYKLVSFIYLLILITGCSSTSRQNATITSGDNLHNMGAIYIQKFVSDKRNLHYIIAEKLTLMGYPATPIDSSDVPNDANTVVYYVDNWEWDITDFMIKIRMEFRGYPGKQLLASGGSYRTSLVRKEPDYMIQETLEQIFMKANIDYHKIK